MYHFVEDHTEGPAIALLTEKSFEVRLGRHIGGRSNIVGFYHLSSLNDFAKAKIYNYGFPSIQQNIRWFQVPMDDVLLRYGQRTP